MTLCELREWDSLCSQRDSERLNRCAILRLPFLIFAKVKNEKRESNNDKFKLHGGSSHFNLI